MTFEKWDWISINVALVFCILLLWLIFIFMLVILFLLLIFNIVATGISLSSSYF